jgi:hypothetical protein
MRFADVVDTGYAPEIFVTGVAAITDIGPGVVRVTYFSEHEMMDGRIERRAVAHLVWPMEKWLEARFLAQQCDTSSGRLRAIPSPAPCCVGGHRDHH